MAEASDGLAILGAALEARHKAESHSDCSHLVHSIYEKAGFPYTYAPSSDLYAGVVDEFRRVMQPQAGDLIVWIGHAGVVVNPAQHTFYSALRTGFGVQAYDSLYWRGRGHPHFFRYIKTPSAPLFAASQRTAALRSTDLRSEVPKLTLKRTDLPLIDTTTPDFTPYLDVDQDLAMLPRVVEVHAVRPKADQVRAALLQGFLATGNALQYTDLLRVSPPLISFDKFEVLKVQVKGDSGWADVRIHQPILVTAPKVHDKKTPERQGWSLHRLNNGSWEVELPGDATYVPRDVAVRLLAHQLAKLTELNSDGNASPDLKAELARRLTLLLEDGTR